MLGWRMLSYLLSLSCRVVLILCRCCRVVVIVVDGDVEPVDNKEGSVRVDKCKYSL
jgi:hypothetical protein